MKAEVAEWPKALAWKASVLLKEVGFSASVVEALAGSKTDPFLFKKKKSSCNPKRKICEPRFAKIYMGKRILPSAPFGFTI